MTKSKIIWKVKIIIFEFIFFFEFCSKYSIYRYIRFSGVPNPPSVDSENAFSLSTQIPENIFRVIVCCCRVSQCRCNRQPQNRHFRYSSEMNCGELMWMMIMMMMINCSQQPSPRRVKIIYIAHRMRGDNIRNERLLLLDVVESGRQAVALKFDFLLLNCLQLCLNLGVREN